MGRGTRPEQAAPPEIFYNADEARKYTANSRMAEIQSTLTERAIELLALPEDGTPRMLLDLGCGSGLSGELLSERGHSWVGLDISEAMLDVAKDREADGDLCQADLGHGLPFRPGMFDGAISISAVQWLCNADTKGADVRARLKRFFSTLYACLARGARAVLQMYPENSEQASMLTTAAMRAGFSGGLVIDFPHSTRAKKYFLVLMVGSAASVPQPRGLEGEDDEEVAIGQRRSKHRKLTSGPVPGTSSRHPDAKGKQWVLKRKQLYRQRGYSNVPQDSKYTGRKRKDHF